MHKLKNKRILWIEDAADYELSFLKTPFYIHSGYDITVAHNLTEAVYQISNSYFDVVIVDLRLPPGDNKDYLRIYEKNLKGNKTSRLGLSLLKSLFSRDNIDLKIDIECPIWLEIKKIVILSVENWSAVRSDLEAIDFPREQFFTKQIYTATDELFNIIQLLLLNHT